MSIAARWFLILLILSSCGSPDRDRVAEGPETPATVPAVLPILRPVNPEVLARSGPNDAGQPTIAVSSSGVIGIVSSGAEDGFMVHLIDTLGVTRAAFGRRGQGPGEVMTVGTLFLASERVHVYDISNRRFTTFDLQGNLVGTGQDARLLLPFAVHGDSADHLETDGASYWVVRNQLSGNGRTVIDRRDSVYQAVFLAPFVSMPDDQPKAMPPARASTRSGYVLGNGHTYRLYRYDAQGRFIDSFGRRDAPETRMSPARVESQMRSLARYRGPDGKLMDPVWLAEQRKDMERKALPFFPQNRSLGFDGAGRLWVVGTIADSMFADLFADTLFLGRLTIGCPDFQQNWALSGVWLGLVCGAPEESDRSALVRLFEVLEGEEIAKRDVGF